MTTLTDFVRQMAPGAPEPSEELFDQVWSALRGLLVVEMKRRSNWSAPPSYLGVVGHAQWTLPEPGTDALDELAAQCFDFIFLRRSTSLREQAENKASIDGLVALAVGHFLLDAQRRNDPLGFRVFEILRRVVKAEVESGRLILVAGDDRIRNDSLLALDAQTTADVILAVDPFPLAERWTLDHLDGLVTASHKALSDLVAQLGRELVGWLDPQAPGFRFGSLAAYLKSSVRQAWGQRFAHEVLGGEAGGLRPEAWSSETEARRRFGRVSRCVADALDDLADRRATRRYLERLWHFLEAVATEHAESFGIDTGGGQTLPSHRQLSQLLDIPRERIPGLLEILGAQLRACREKMDSWTEEMPMPPTSSNRSPRDKAWAAALAARKGAHRISGSTGDGAQDGSPPGAGAWTVGDVVHLAEADFPGVHWLLLSAETGTSGFRAAPVDSFPLLGPGDLTLADLDPPEPWILRRSFELHLGPEPLRQAKRLWRADVTRLAQLLAAPDLEGQHLVEEDLPAYREWIDAGPAAAHRQMLATPLPNPLVFTRPTAGPRPWTRWAAAALLLVALGLGAQLVRLQTAVDRLSEPILGLPYREVQFNPSHRGTWQLRIPSDASHIEIGMVLVDQPDYDTYRIELLGPGDELLYRSPELEPRDAYSLTFRVEQIDRPALVFRLLGVRDGATEVLDEQEIRVERGAEP